MTKNKRRKHRVYVDVTFSKPVTRRDAAKGLQLVLDTRLDLAYRPVWYNDSSFCIDKLRVVELTEGEAAAT